MTSHNAIRLAVELSSETASLALLDGTQVLASRRWRKQRRAQQQVFAECKALLEEAGCRAADLQGVDVGRGPGAYSGIRNAFALAAGLTLGREDSCYALSSASVLALQAAEQQSLAPGRCVLAAGDARRGCLWWGLHSVAEGKAGPEVALVGDWRLVDFTEAAEALRGVDAAVSPDWERLARSLPAPARQGPWAAEPHYPDAAALGRWAARRRAAGVPSEPQAPLYLHPAVRANP